MKNLTQIAIQRKVLIHSFTDKAIARKLITMGVIPGREIEILRKAPFSGGFYISVEENYLAIRKSEAVNVIIEEFE